MGSTDTHLMLPCSVDTKTFDSSSYYLQRERQVFEHYFRHVWNSHYAGRERRRKFDAQIGVNTALIYECHKISFKIIFEDTVIGRECSSIPNATTEQMSYIDIVPKSQVSSP